MSRRKRKQKGRLTLGKTRAAHSLRSDERGAVTTRMCADLHEPNHIQTAADAPEDACAREAEPVPYEESLLENARTQWQFGDWERLAALNLDRIQHHPQRAKLALLAAAGHFQCGGLNDAHRYVRLAQDWGCNPRLIAQVLASGTHQSLADAAKHLDQTDRAHQHTVASVKVCGVPGDHQLLARVRLALENLKAQRNKAAEERGKD